MLNRSKINFDDIYSYATQKPQLYNLELVIKNADKDVANENLNTINQYRYIYCESDNTFASQVGREVSTSAKNYGLLGLEAAGVGTCALIAIGEASLPASAIAVGVGGVGGALLGGIAGGARAISARTRGMLLETPEEKERVIELQRLAQNRVAVLNPIQNGVELEQKRANPSQNEVIPTRQRAHARLFQKLVREEKTHQESKNISSPKCSKC